MTNRNILSLLALATTAAALTFESTIHSTHETSVTFIGNMLSEENRATTMCAGAWLAVAVGLIAIYYKRGFATCTAILVYVFALSSMSALIKNCYVTHEFKYPQFVTATHFVATAAVGCCVLAYRYVQTGQTVNVPNVNCVFKGLLPVAVFFVASLGSANNGLLYSNAHFYEMIGGGTPIVTAGMSVMLGKGFDFQLSPPLALITLSTVVVAFGEVNYTTLGLLCCIGAVVFRSAKSQAQHLLMGGTEWKSMDPVEVAVWTSISCFVLISAWSVVSEGAAPWGKILAWGPFLAVLATCAGAATLNIAALFVLKELGPVAQQIVGQLKGLLACLVAVAKFGEVISTQQAIGYTILLIGVAWFNVQDMKIKNGKKAAETANETTNLKKPIQKV